VYNQIASIRDRQNDLLTAKNLYVKSLEIRRKLARRDPSNNAWLDYLATEYGRTADLLVKMNDVPGAITNYKSANNVWDIFISRIPDQTDWIRKSAEVLQKLTELSLANQQKLLPLRKPRY